MAWRSRAEETNRATKTVVASDAAFTAARSHVLCRTRSAVTLGRIATRTGMGSGKTIAAATRTAPPTVNSRSRSLIGKRSASSLQTMKRRGPNQLHEGVSCSGRSGRRTQTTIARPTVTRAQNAARPAAGRPPVLRLRPTSGGARFRSRRRLDDRHPHPVAEDRIAALSLALGGVHGEIGAAQEIGRIDLAGGDACDADGGVGPAGVAGDVERRVQGIEDALGDGGGLGLLRDVLHQDRELIPSEPRQGVVGPYRDAHPIGDLDEKGVPGSVAEAVVDGLEIVE